MYGDYAYTYDEYGTYYNAEDYGENYYGENTGTGYITDSNITEDDIAEESNVAENIDANMAEHGMENIGTSEEDGTSNVTFASASAGVEKALQGAIPRPALGLPPPDVPSSQRPPRPVCSPFENVPLEKETRKKRVKKVWKSSKSKKKDKDK